jgi:hypothetical protein
MQKHHKNHWLSTGLRRLKWQETFLNNFYSAKLEVNITASLKLPQNVWLEQGILPQSLVANGLFRLSALLELLI